jgi:hypothetical protein
VSEILPNAYGTNLLVDFIVEGGAFLLDGGDMGLEFTPDSFQFSHDGTVESSSERRVVLGKDLGLVSHFVQDFLPSSFAQEVVAFVEWDCAPRVSSDSF